MITIFLFYDTSYGIQVKLSFSKSMKHVNIIQFDGVLWLALSSSSDGITWKTLNLSCSAQRFIEKLKIIPELSAIVVTCSLSRHHKSWCPLIIHSCNEACRYISGLNLGWTFNPRHLYNKLLKWDNRTNYEIIYHWRRDNGIRKQPSTRSSERNG